MPTQSTATDPLSPPTTPKEPARPDVPAKKLEVGALVLYVMRSGPSAGESRPATCIRAFDWLCGNLKVDLDGEADFGQEDGEFRDQLSVRVTSVPFGGPDKPGTWY